MKVVHLFYNTYGFHIAGIIRQFTADSKSHTDVDVVNYVVRGIANLGARNYHCIRFSNNIRLIKFPNYDHNPEYCCFMICFQTLHLMITMVFVSTFTF